MPRLSARLPKDPTQNGLEAIARDLLDDPLKRRIVIAVVDCSKITTDTETGEREATVRVRRIEQVNPADMAEAERLVRRALEYRSGETVLPIDIEKDLTAWFGEDFDVDLDTGEVNVPDDALTDDPDQADVDDADEGGDDS